MIFVFQPSRFRAKPTVVPLPLNRESRTVIASEEGLHGPTKPLYNVPEAPEADLELFGKFILQGKMSPIHIGTDNFFCARLG